jgi:hypothetical protein
MLAIRDSKRLKAINVKVPGNWVPCLFVDLGGAQTDQTQKPRKVPDPSIP